MFTPTHALLAFRRRPLALPADRALPAIFTLEPCMYLTAAVVASWNPVSTLQVHGGATAVSEPSVRATLEQAIVSLGARTVVVCAESTAPPERESDRDRLLQGCRALLEDAALGAQLRERRVAIEGLWFDTTEGDIHRWNADARRLELLTDEGLASFFAAVSERAT